jgi:hypothetical protein
MITIIADLPLKRTWLADAVNVLLHSPDGTAHIGTIVDRIIKMGRDVGVEPEATVTRTINNYCSDALDFNRSPEFDLFSRVNDATYRLRAYPAIPHLIEIQDIEFEKPVYQKVWREFSHILKTKQKAAWTRATHEKRLDSFIRLTGPGGPLEYLWTIHGGDGWTFGGLRAGAAADLAARSAISPFPIRTLCRSDAGAVIGIFHQISHEIPVNLSTPDRIAALTKTIEGKYCNSYSLVATDSDSRMVGFLLANHHRGEAIHLAYIGITPSCRGNHIFSRLLDITKSHGQRIFAEVVPGNTSDMPTKLIKQKFSLTSEEFIKYPMFLWTPGTE